MFRSLLTGIVFAFCVSAACAAPSSCDNGLFLRIGLKKHFSHAPGLLISDSGRFHIRCTQTGQTVFSGKPGAVYEVAPLLTSALVAVSDDAQPLKIAREAFAPSQSGPLPSWGQTPAWTRYRGALTVTADPAGGLQVVNTLSLEEYLYGVIPAEIGADVPMQAMQAQAVAARTYAVKNRNKFAAEGFDLDDTTHSEGYFGVDGETPQSNAAVDATRGMVLTWNGTLIDAPYSTDSGGMTACDPTSPYLQAVRDAPSPAGPDYAASEKYHTWTLTYSQRQLQAALERDPRTSVTDFKAFTIDGFDASGRITTVTVTATDGTAKTVTGPQLRAILGYDTLRSTLVTLTVLPSGGYRFTGKGWGHGFGMSQEGAVAMASPPYHKNCAEILSHYYVGTALTPLSVALLASSATPQALREASRPRHGL